MIWEHCFMDWDHSRAHSSLKMISKSQEYPSRHPIVLEQEGQDGTDSLTVA